MGLALVILVFSSLNDSLIPSGLILQPYELSSPLHHPQSSEEPPLQQLSEGTPRAQELQAVLDTEQGEVTHIPMPSELTFGHANTHLEVG